jgi:large subunit ribosomal protein L24
VNKIRKGDKVILNTGKDKGKQGIVLNILKNNRVVVEGLNMVKKHTKPNPAKGDQGGLVSKEMPINISNIAIFNTKSNKTDKVNCKELKDGKKIRIYKSTQEAIDV